MSAPASAAPAFHLSDIGYRYPGAGEALAGIGFDITAGERVAVLGANGTGKSTLLAIMDGLIFPTSGEIVALGIPLSEKALRDPEVSRAFRSRVGFVFQDADAQLFSANVYEEIAFGPLQLGLADDEVRDRVEATIGELGLGRIADRAPFLLSGGEKKRVALASVMAIDPDILLLDEPTTGLDPRTQVWLMEVLQHMHARGKTVVLATHDLSFADEVVDRCIVLSEEHRMVADASTEDILEDEATLLAVNLIHEHAHSHGAAYHAHPHAHGLGHAHEHGDSQEPDDAHQLGEEAGDSSPRE
jgi:cobalt/nickel transport system ATP-binding protein